MVRHHDSEAFYKELPEEEMLQKLGRKLRYANKWMDEPSIDLLKKAWSATQDNYFAIREARKQLLGHKLSLAFRFDLEDIETEDEVEEVGNEAGN